jgi:cytochrome P450
MLKPLRDTWDMVRSLHRARNNMITAWPKSYYRREFAHERYLGRSHFLVNDPVGVHWVMVGNARNYRKSPANTQTLKPLLGNGLFVSEGDLWTRQRRTMNPATHTQRLEGYARTIVETTAEMLAGWRAHGPDGFMRDVTEPFTLVTAEIISRLMFNYPLGQQGMRLFEAFKDYQASHGRVHMSEFFGVPSWFPRPGRRRGRRAVEKFDAVLLEIIRTARARGQPCEFDDLLQMLLDFRDEQGQPMDPALVRDEVASIFLAGHETTAITLTWAFYLLEKHPRVQARLLQEIADVLGARSPTFADLGKLAWARAIVEETLRLYPPVHVFSRQAIDDDIVCGQPVPAGSLVTISSWVLHRHQKYWDDPAAFKPERFLPAQAHITNRAAYLPFGLGPRVCLGKHLGLMEATLLLTMVAQNFELRLKPGHPVEPLGRMTLRPRFGMPMQIVARVAHPAAPASVQ